MQRCEAVEALPAPAGMPEDALHAAFEASPDALLLLDAQRNADGMLAAFHCRYANPSALRVFGDAAAASIGAGSRDGLGQLFEVLRLVADHGEPWQGDYVHRNAHATTWLRCCAWRNGDAVVLSCADATVRHDALSAMQGEAGRQFFLRELADGLACHTRPEELQQAACSALAQHLGLAMVCYAETGPDGKLREAARHGGLRLPGCPALNGAPEALPPALGRIVAAGEARFIGDLRRAACEESLFGPAARAAAIIPVRRDGKLAGLLACADTVSRAWSRHERQLLAEVARRIDAATARANAQLAMAVQVHSLELLHEMGVRMAKAPCLDSMLGEVLDATIQLHGAFAGNVQLYEAESGVLRLAAQRGFKPEFTARFSCVRASDSTACGRALASGKRVVVEDVDQEHGLADLRAAALFGGFRAVQSTPLFSGVGDLLGVLSTHFAAPRSFSDVELGLTDLYARHAADALGAHLREREQSRHNALLERRVAERTREREQAEERLRQSEKLKAIGQLTGGIAHDFNNMLQTISSGINLVRLRLQQGKLGEVEGYLRRAEKGAQRAAALTQRLLAFSRQQTLAPKCVSLGRIASEMEDMLRRAVGPSVQVDMQVSGGSWLVMCDPNQMESALLNLCVNARDAMPEGGWLTISTEEVELDAARAACIEGAAPGRYAVIAVADTGQGMAPEVLAHVFEPFFTTKPLGKGTGLGLSQIYGFVRQSGGFVQVESSPKAGTTVRLCLPYSATDPDAAQPASSGHAGTLLLVEDEQDVREMAGEQLREHGFRVLEADSGPAAIRLAQADPHIDLLITDIGLPGGMDGIQVLGAVRERHPVLPVILISGYAGPDGVDAELLHKPFQLAELVDRVKAKLAHP